MEDIENRMKEMILEGEANLKYIRAQRQLEMEEDVKEKKSLTKKTMEKFQKEADAPEKCIDDVDESCMRELLDHIECRQQRFCMMFCHQMDQVDHTYTEECVFYSRELSKRHGSEVLKTISSMPYVRHVSLSYEHTFLHARVTFHVTEQLIKKKIDTLDHHQGIIRTVLLRVFDDAQPEEFDRNSFVVDLNHIECDRLKNIQVGYCGYSYKIWCLVKQEFMQMNPRIVDIHWMPSRDNEDTPSFVWIVLSPLSK
jgi:tRNA G18 (ribose-2'-O)-methylase SpoU